MFKVRSLKKQFETIHDFGLENLIVSGCSFTYNNSEEHLCTWPYYLKDFGGFKEVYDCSMPGAGNYHISHSLQWNLETTNFNPEKSLVIVMWSGNDRDDCILSADSCNLDYPFKFNYETGVMSGITGGSYSSASGNNSNLRTIVSIKDKKSRSIENYLYVNNLKCYLDRAGYKSVFLNYMLRDMPNWPDFEIQEFLPKSLKKKFNSLFTNIETIHKYSVTHGLLMSDDLFHPTPQGHLSWTKEILLPSLKATL